MEAGGLLFRILSKYLTDEDPMSLTKTLKALSDPTRRRIIEMLREGDMTAGEIADRFHITKPSISHHLALLKQAELVEDERHGQNIWYSLNISVMEEILNWVIDMKKGGNRDGKE